MTGEEMGLTVVEDRDDTDFSDRPEVRAAKIATRRLIEEGERVAEEATRHHDELRQLLEAIRAEQP